MTSISDDIRNRRDNDKALEKILGFERSTYDQVHAVNNKLTLMESEQKHIQEKLDSLVSRLEFTPVKLLVYGMTSITLASVIAAVIALVIHRV